MSNGVGGGGCSHTALELTVCRLLKNYLRDNNTNVLLVEIYFQFYIFDVNKTCYELVLDIVDPK